MKIFKDWRPVGYCPNCECVMCNQQTLELRMITQKMFIKNLKKKFNKKKPKNKGD